MAQLLLVEDDPVIRVELTRALRAQGYAVESVGTGGQALQRIGADPPNLVVLDLGLPDIDGWQVLRMVRATSGVPVIVETARDDEPELVRTLNAGADDYVVKPFTAQQLGARIAAVLRRTESGSPAQPIVVGQLCIDPLARRACLGERELTLSVKEFDLLVYLAERAGTVVSKRALLTEVWRQPYGAEKTIDVHLSWLRRKLGESGAQPQYLHTVRGAGVRLAAPQS